METRLITNDQQLRRYLPNAFDTVEGETTFHEKILPWLDQAERHREQPEHRSGKPA